MIVITRVLLVGIRIQLKIGTVHLDLKNSLDILYEIFIHRGLIVFVNILCFLPNLLLYLPILVTTLNSILTLLFCLVIYTSSSSLFNQICIIISLITDRVHYTTMSQPTNQVIVNV